MPAAPPRHPREVRAWLDQEPSLTQLQEAYPREWAVVQRELAEIVPRGDREELTRYVASLAAGGGAAAAGRRRGLADVSGEIRRHMAVEAIKQLSLQAATGVTQGRVRFNLINGKVAQRLLFEGGGFERKPVSMFWFKTLWPVLWQRRYLMPLVAKKGIYCFYSRPLIAALAAEIGERGALEIAAGDGTLTRFLRERGRGRDGHRRSQLARRQLPAVGGQGGREAVAEGARAAGRAVLLAAGEQRLRAGGVQHP